MRKLPFYRFLSILMCLACVSASQLVSAQPNIDISGEWVFNQKASDNTDDLVEKALKEMGQKPKRSWFNRDKEFYRGGPEDQELYDRISYDRELKIEVDGENFLFTYAGTYERPIYTDNRRRSVSLTALDDVKDFSFAHWSKDALLVEARPRDGGFADETYTLINAGSQLKVELYIQPRTFNTPIEITRIFDRKM